MSRNGVNLESHQTLPVNIGYAYKCFPIRGIRKSNFQDGGAWVVEFKAEKRRQLEASNKRKYIRSYKREKPTVELNGLYLTKRHCVEKPYDLCSINISGQDLHPDKNEDFSLFENVVSIDASDNKLTFEIFKSFPKLENLQQQVNSITCIHINHREFTCLKKLDLSYNLLETDALLNLGKLRNLEELQLQGCSLVDLPVELGRGYVVSEGESDVRKEKCDSKRRFPKLTFLNLSENELTNISTFASVAGLRRLRHLDLSHNKITSVPHLRLMVAHRHFSISTCAISSASHYPLLHEDSSPGRAHPVVPNVSNVTGVSTDSVRQNTAESPQRRSPVECYEMNVANTEQLENIIEQTDQPNNDEVHDLDKKVEEMLSGTGLDERDDDVMNIDFGKELNFDLADDLLGDDVTQDGSHNEGEAKDEHLLNDDVKRPFPVLEILDLSHNEIADEAALLALASWPSLQELKIWGNPLMRCYKDTPPVIKHHLQKMCGITIVRKAPKEESMKQLIAPAIAETTKTYRVKAQLPPIKRNNLLMIEAAIQNAVQNKNQARESVTNEKIPTESNEKQDSENLSATNENFDGEQIFLTQVDEDCYAEPTPKVAQEKQPSRQKSHVPKKYKGYELLLKPDAKEEGTEHLPLPDTIQGSVNALKHLLDHPLVFKEGEYNENKIKIHKKKQKKSKPKLVARKSSSSEMDEISKALDNIRMEKTSVEENLASVLENYHNDEKMRKQFPDVHRMVDRVQQKYDEVRLASLRPISAAERDVRHLSTRSEQPPKELILSRMKQNRIGDLCPGSRGNTPRTKFRGTTPSIPK